MDFRLGRGTNVSHWLTDPRLRGRIRKKYFTVADVRFMSEMGLDHFRLPVAEALMWSPDGTPDPEKFGFLHSALDWAEQCGLRVIVDLHETNSHSNRPPLTLFERRREQARFGRLWLDLSRSLRSRSVSTVAYELLNEPRAPTSEIWNRTYKRVFRKLRDAEPERVIVVGSNDMQAIAGLDELELPPSDLNVIMSFHFYFPTTVSHYGAEWLNLGRYDGPIQYPGRPFAAADLTGFSRQLGREISRANRPVTRQVLAAHLKQATEVRERTGIPLWCGEFGCIETTPRDVRRRWLTDVVGLLEELSIPWCQWDWKGRFGLLDRRTWRPSVVHRALGLRHPAGSRPSRPFSQDVQPLGYRLYSAVSRHVWRLRQRLK